jgi:cobalt-zinc-cadmium efflux system protein
MAHAHHHHQASPLGWAVIATMALVALKSVGALLAHSLALAADAAHSLTDVFALGASWYAYRQAQKPPTARLTFGFGRAEVLAALLNSLFLFFVSAGLIFVAVTSWRHMAPAQPQIMLATEAVAMAVDFTLAFRMGRSRNANWQAAWIHLLSDAMGSIAVIIGALVLWWTDWPWINPVLTIFIALFIVVGTWHILQDTVTILLEATPHDIELGEVTRAMQNVAGVVRVHDVHIWSVGQGQTAIACHVEISDRLTLSDSQQILQNLSMVLKKLGIDHMTVQMETVPRHHLEPKW